MHLNEESKFCPEKSSSFFFLFIFAFYYRVSESFSFFSSFSSFHETRTERTEFIAEKLPRDMRGSIRRHPQGRFVVSCMRQFITPVTSESKATRRQPCRDLRERKENQTAFVISQPESTGVVKSYRKGKLLHSHTVSAHYRLCPCKRGLDCLGNSINFNCVNFA